MRSSVSVVLVLCSCTLLNCRRPAVAIETAGACASNSSTAWQMRVAAVKNAILAKLGFSSPPESSLGGKASPSLAAAYNAAVASSQRRTASGNKICEEESKSLFAKTILFYAPMSYSLSIPAYSTLRLGSTTPISIPPESYRLKFKLNIPNHSLVAYSQLRLYKKSVLNDVMFKTDSVGVEVYVIPPMDNSARAVVQQAVAPKLVYSRMMDTMSNGVEAFDVTSAVQQYASSGQKLQILDLQVVIKTPVSLASGLKFPPPVKFVTDGAQGGNSTQLVVALLQREEVSGANAKRKRAAEVNSAYCTSTPTEQNCCLRPLEINFSKDLGWNWIISPKSYKANYCQGFCPSYWPSATTSTSFLLNYRQANPTSAVHPCCGTAVLKPLTVLGIANGAPFLVELPNMIVESCLCR